MTIKQSNGKNKIESGDKTMWPGNNKEKSNKEFETELSKVFEKFGTIILTNWLSNIFDRETIINIGVDYLIEIGNCENCNNYVGIDPIKRKMKKVLVLSGFCNERQDRVRYPSQSVCGSFDPKNIFKKIIEMEKRNYKMKEVNNDNKKDGKKETSPERKGTRYGEKYAC